MRKAYAYHSPSPESKDLIAKLREAFSNLHEMIHNAALDSREKSIALTNLETTAMWAIKAVVHTDPNSKVEY